MSARRRPARHARQPEISAALLAIVLSLAMANLGDIYGLLQRAMFVVAYVWYGYQAVQVASLASRDGATGSRQ